MVNNMLTEDYVSSETAKLLKEKGFKEWCRQCYGLDVRHNGEPIDVDEEYELKDAGRENEIEYVDGGRMYDYGCGNFNPGSPYAAPSLYVAMKWLRKNFNLNPVPYALSLGWAFDVFDLSDRDITGCKKLYSMDFPTKNTCYETYEEAAEAAIKYCLEKLI